MTEDRRILVAEDDALACKSIFDLLTRNGYAVTAVADGEAAWQQLQQDTPPHVVLLDWMMPRMNGMEVMEKIRTNPSRASLYVIFLTARNATDDITASLNIGANDFVSKPFNEDELIARIQVAFRTVALEAALARRVAELEQAIRRITQLEGILPICARCKKIRETDNSWKAIEEYLIKRTPVSFTHGYCPDCFAIEMAEINAQ